MQSLFKPSLIFILLLISCFVVKAQVKLKKPDVIQKIDKTSLEVVIDEINKTEILYRKANDPKGPLYAMPKKEVRKIIWNNGDVEDITLAPATTQPPQKAVDPKAKHDVKELLFWDNQGLFAGVRAGAGLGTVTTPHTAVLASGAKLVYNIGGTLGYRVKAFTLQIEALYTSLSYGMNVQDNMQRVKSIDGHQTNLVLPLTATVYTKMNKTRLGLTLGGFGAMQIGVGSTEVTYLESNVTNVKNCRECADKAIFGVIGGVTATVVERPTHSIFIDARYYHSLSNNSEYKIAESGVKMNTAIVGAGVLFNLAH